VNVPLAEQILATIVATLEGSPELRDRLRALLGVAVVERDEWVRGEETGIAASTRKRLVRAGKLTAHRVGREFLFKRSEVDAYIASRAVVREVEAHEGESEVDRVIRRKRERGGR
jgi:excisionase family DNA binding protein